jgi:hypothetical protein
MCINGCLGEFKRSLNTYNSGNPWGSGGQSEPLVFVSGDNVARLKNGKS